MPLKTMKDESPSLNLTSMIDVLFLLIIFFMVGTKFADLERNVDLTLPKVAENKALSDAPAKRVINVLKDGQIVMNNQTFTLAALSDELKNSVRQFPKLGVLVRGDGDSAYKFVATVLATCRQAGVTDYGLAVELAQKP